MGTLLFGVFVALAMAASEARAGLKHWLAAPLLVGIGIWGVGWFFDNLLIGLILICLIWAALTLASGPLSEPTTYTDVKYYEEMVNIIDDVATELYMDEKMTARSIIRDLMDVAENPEQPIRPWIPWFPNMPVEQYVEACADVAAGFINA